MRKQKCQLQGIRNYKNTFYYIYNEKLSCSNMEIEKYWKKCILDLFLLLLNSFILLIWFTKYLISSEKVF